MAVVALGAVVFALLAIMSGGSTYEVSARVRRPLWLRSLVVEPRFGARPWQLWQASNFRRLRGIEGRVDWNVQRP